MACQDWLLAPRKRPWSPLWNVSTHFHIIESCSKVFYCQAIQKSEVLVARVCPDVAFWFSTSVLQKYSMKT